MHRDISIRIAVAGVVVQMIEVSVVNFDLVVFHYFKFLNYDEVK